MRVSIVVQRYGPDVLGGAERHARQVAERLAERHEVQALTTCAHDYATWANAYPPGESVVNGVQVLRFPTAQPRAANLAQLWDRVHLRVHTLADELTWLRAQGPYAPGLLDHLRQYRDESDVFIFFTYLYYPTAMGLRLVADKSILVPTAHDEDPIYLSLFRNVFHSPRAILYNTEEERRFVERHFDNGYVPNAVVGVGVDTPDTPQPERFRARFGLDKPYFLYLGRIVPDKGCDEMLDYFDAYRRAFPDEAVLTLVGHGEMPLPSAPWLVPTGFIHDEDKVDAIAGAEGVIVPSRYESMSLTTLEAWSLGRPVICTAHSPVVRGLVRRAGGGLYYGDSEEFVEALHLLASDRDTADGLGRQGRRFTRATYRWPDVIATYQRFIEDIAAQPWR